MTQLDYDVTLATYLEVYLVHFSWESTLEGKKSFFLSSARFACHRGEGNKKSTVGLRRRRHS